MLERIREGSQGIVAKSILSLVILTFAISGIGSYINSKAETTVMTVNGVEITKSAVDQAYQNGRQQMQAQYGEMVEQLFADEGYVARYREQILENLVVEELQKQQAKEIGVRISDEQIRKAIIEMPAFQVGGTFNNDVYIAKIRQAGYTTTQFREMMREQMGRTQFSGSVLGTDFALPSEQSRYAALMGQKRSFDVIKFDAKTLEAEVTLTDEDIQNYYDLNASRFQTEEKVAFEYILIDSAKLAANVQVSETDLKDYYDNNIAEFTTAEKRRIAHIMVESGDEAKVAEIQSKLAAGEAFAEVAKALSEDTFSAENGGDLEYFEAGVFGDAFDEAVLALTEVGQVSDLVETESGKHFITMTEFKAEEVKSFESVKGQLDEDARESKVAELYIEAQTKVEEVAFEVPDNLADAAKESGLTLETQELVSRIKLSHPLNNALLTNKLFDEDFIEGGFNSELINLNDTQSVVVRILDHEASRQQTLDEVKSVVTAAVKQQKASELAQQKAQDLLAKIQGGLDYVADDSIVAVSYDDIGRNDTKVDRAVKEHVFTMVKPTENARSSDWVATSSNGAAVVILKSVVTEPVEDTGNSSQLASLMAQLTNKAFVESAKANADISR